MQFNLETARALGYTGQPLELQVTEDSGDAPEKRTFTVENRDGRKFQIRDGYNTLESIIKNLGSALRFYPAAVRINGDPVGTGPFPDLAHVFTTGYEENNRRYYSFNSHQPDPENPLPGGFNALAGGVLCRLDHPLTLRREVYFSAVPGETRNWQRARRVEIRPILVIEAGEMDRMVQEKSGPPATGLDPALEEALRERTERQIQKTLACPNMPPRHHGPVFRYALTGPGDRKAPFEEGAPIIVNGTPVILECGEDEEHPAAEAVAALEALYRSGQKFVPVDFTKEQQKDPPAHRVIDGFDFKVTPGDLKPEGLPWCMEAVPGVTLEFHLEGDEETRRVPAAFHLEGEDQWEKYVSFVPGSVTTEELTGAIVRAYWEEGEVSSWDDLKDRLQEMEEEVRDLVQAALEDPVEAFTRQLQKLADRFHSEIPWPKEPIAVTSRNGSITIISNPQPE